VRGGSGHRAQSGGGVKGIAEYIALRPGNGDVFGLAEPIAGAQDPGQPAADLAGIAEAILDPGGDGLLEVGIGQDHVRRLTCG
jgi:hypothetical protein